MANDVKYMVGTKASYDALATKNEYAFYYLNDTHELYLGNIDLSNLKDLKDLKDKIETIGGLKLDDLNTDATTLTEVINNLIEQITGANGTNTGSTLADLETDDKDSLISALNELVGRVKDLEDATPSSSASTWEAF